MDEDDIEVIDLDEFEEELDQEYTSDGFNLETGEYDPKHDAWNPPISSYGLLKELEEKYGYKGENNETNQK